MKFNFAGKTILITGASSGIGAALAREIVRRGGRVALLARREDALRGLASAIDPEAKCTSVHPCDVSNHGQIKKAITEVQQRWGEIDMAIFSAGIGHATRFKEFKAAQTEEIFRVNLFGMTNCLEFLLPEMLRRGKGHIVGISSLMAHFNSKWLAAYAASKSAVSDYLCSMQRALKKYGITTICVEPGFVRTAMTAENRHLPFLMEVEDAARRIVRGIERGKTMIRFPLPLSLGALANRLLPTRLRYLP